MWRVCPASLGPAKKKKAAGPGQPKPKSEIRGWMILGSHNLSKAAVSAWCGGLTPLRLVDALVCERGFGGGANPTPPERGECVISV